MGFQVRQGDVLIVGIAQMPTGGLTEVERDNGRIVLAYGEVTGHSHAIADANATMFTSPETTDRFLRIMNASGVALVHEEHGSIALPAGQYIVRIQREYVPGELTRNVAD